jgi:hypothetical protein
MVVNFITRGINWGTRKLVRIPTLIKKEEEGRRMWSNASFKFIN